MGASAVVLVVRGECTRTIPMRAFGSVDSLLQIGGSMLASCLPYLRTSISMLALCLARPLYPLLTKWIDKSMNIPSMLENIMYFGQGHDIDDAVQRTRESTLSPANPELPS